MFTLDVRYHGNGHGNWDELTKTCYMVVNIPNRAGHGNFDELTKTCYNGSKHTPQGPHFHPFRSTMSRLKVVGDLKIPIGKQWLLFKILILF